MAIFASWIGFNYDYFNFYELVDGFTSNGLQNDLGFTSSYTKNGQTVGAYLNDSFYTQFQIQGVTYSTAFFSEKDITYDGTNLSSLAGTINTIGAVAFVENGSSLPLYGITGVNIDVNDLMHAVLSPSLDDDRSIVGEMLNGDDTFNLSDEADLARGLNGSDTMYGYAGNDKLYGGKNNDKLYGGNGNDKSYGQAGNDSLYMDAGNDTLDGGTGTDWLYVTGSTNSVVNLAKTTGQNTGYGTDIIKNIENASGGTGVDKFYGTTGNNTLKGNNGNDILQGKNGNDNLQGNNGNDKLYGGAGNDKLIGGNNNDRLQGDAGNDVLNGGGGVDTIVFTGNKATSVNLGSRAAQNTGHGRDTITGVENVTSGAGDDTLRGSSVSNKLIGNNGDDTLAGFGGDDTLGGGGGNDILKGGVGKDILLGGAGADTFVFTNTSHSSATISRADIIKDFTGGVDKIDLSAIDASTVLAGNNIFTFDGTTPIGTSQLGDIYYKQFDKTGTVNDHTMLFVDTDNDRGREMSIKLTGLIDLSADDFIL